MGDFNAIVGEGI